MDKDLISIIIPVYNTGKTAKELTESLLRNKYSNIEIILVDDGSKDDSLKTLKEIRDKRVKIFSKENGGASSARNFGIKKSSGKYIIFLDSDDEISMDFVPELYKGINQNKNTRLAVTSVEYHRVKENTHKPVYMKDIKRKKNETLRTYILKMLVTDGRIYSSTNKIYEAAVIKNNNILFDEKRNFAEDTKFVLDYLKAVDPCEVKLILKPLYHYKFGTETSTIKKSSTIWKNWQKSYQDVTKWVGNKPTMNERTLLILLKTRWRISYLRSVRRSK